MHRGLRGDWEDVVHREDMRGRRRVVRMVYEVATRSRHVAGYVTSGTIGLDQRTVRTVRTYAAIGEWRLVTRCLPAPLLDEL
jgi:hypothetical protein